MAVQFKVFTLAGLQNPGQIYDGGAITAGNLLTAFIHWNNNTITLNSVDDDKGNSWVIRDNPTQQDVNNVGAHAYALNAIAGTTTVTFHFSAALDGGGGNTACIVESAVTGVVLDQSNIRALNNPGTGSDAVAGTAATLTGSNEYCLGWCSGKFASTATNPGTNGWSTVTLSTMNVEEQSNVNTTMTTKFTGPAEDWVIGILTFKASGGGGGTGPMFRGS